jgi:hypothetical protein
MVYALSARAGQSHVFVLFAAAVVPRGILRSLCCSPRSVSAVDTIAGLIRLRSVLATPTHSPGRSRQQKGPRHKRWQRGRSRALLGCRRGGSHATRPGEAARQRATDGSRHPAQTRLRRQGHRLRSSSRRACACRRCQGRGVAMAVHSSTAAAAPPAAPPGGARAPTHSTHRRPQRRRRTCSPPAPSRSLSSASLDLTSALRCPSTWQAHEH